MNGTKTARYSKQGLRWRPWLVGGLILLAALVFIVIEMLWLQNWPAGSRLIFRLIQTSLLFVVIYLPVASVERLKAERRVLQVRLDQTERSLSEAYQRLDTLSRIREQFSQAEDEDDIIDLVLHHSVELTGAAGASFVPLDERGRPRTAVSYGNPPLPLPDAWVEYLATPDIRSRCNLCEKHNYFVTTCPLLQGPFSEAAGMYCIPLKRGENEFGVLNLYIPDSSRLNAETRTFLLSLIDETAQALESVWLKKRELGSLRQLHAVRQKADLSSLLSNLIGNVYQTLEADFALLALQKAKSLPTGEDQQVSPLINDELTRGKLEPQVRPFIEKLIHEVLSGGEAVSMSGTEGDQALPPGVRALLAAPLLVGEEPALGVLIIGNNRTRGFHQRQVSVFHTVASQMALVVQNAQELAKLEYNAMIQERTRLAREIHDGLAQTLGFLKLQVALMQGYLERHEFDRLRQSIQLYYETLSEAYQDARYSIDGLRISPSVSGFNEWLQQMLAEFQENVESQALMVNLTCFEVNTCLPSEVQAQLIRIVQEALSNVRKHAQANNVWISCLERDGELVLEIQDDGRGFAAEDVPGSSQHGLKGIRERTELIGAELQLISQPQQGTTVRISLPTKVGEVVL